MARGVGSVSIVKNNAITVPREDFDEFVRRFGAPAEPWRTNRRACHHKGLPIYPDRRTFHGIEGECRCRWRECQQPMPRTHP
jgi:hypothetical protein